MSIIDDFTEKVAKTARCAAKKSGELVEITKMNINIGIEEDKISKYYSDIGKLIYDRYLKNQNFDTEIEAICEHIKFKENLIKEMNQKILNFKNMRICPNCNSQISTNFDFCNNCGTKQDNTEYYQEIVLEKSCPNCTSTVSPTSQYCYKCGAKIYE